MIALLALSAALAAPSGWRLVGAVDASSALALEPAIRAPYVWTPPEGMRASCGPAKAPDGLGLFEAEAMAAGLAPALALVLERTEGAELPHPGNLRIALGRGRPELLLRPAVLPRNLAVRIEGDAALRHRQLVRTQIEAELCMEHKVGRGWTGGETTALRQAFLLDPPETGRPDRKYFGGQRDPIPALLGPPDACLQRAEGFAEREGPGGRGEGSADLVPSDVWGATLRWCDATERGGAATAGEVRPVPLRLQGTEAPHLATPRWQDLVIQLEGGEAEAEVRVTMRLDDQILLDRSPLYTRAEATEAGTIPGLTDLVAHVPYRYPTAGTASAPDRYAVLLVPDWQVVEGILRLGLENPSSPLPSAPEGARNGVAWLLSHPELLHVQVPPVGGSPTASDWLDLGGPLRGGAMFGLRWGFTTGLLASRTPAVLPAALAPGEALGRAAHRAEEHSAFLASAAIVLAMVLLGLRRLPDLWSRVPEERADYWPGPGGLPSGAEPALPAGAPPAAPGGGA